MITAFNRSQIFKGTLLIWGGLLCYGVAWLFFRYGLEFALRQLNWPDIAVEGLAVAALFLITWSGHRHWRNGGGFRSYVESSLFHDFGSDAAAGIVVDHYARRITGPAYLLSQILLGGPVLVLRGLKHLQQRLPNNAELEARVRNTLKVLRAADKWQSMTDYPDLQTEILMLALMKKIDFSAHKGTPRIHASTHGI